MSTIRDTGGSEEVRQDQIQSHLQKRILKELMNERFSCSGELICGIVDLPLFYQRRNYAPAWIDSQKFSTYIPEFIAEIGRSYDEGLRPQDYHLEKIKALSDKITKSRAVNNTLDVDDLVDFELLCTDAFLLLGSHYLAGRVNPETIHTEWVVNNPKANLAVFLQNALDEKRIKSRLTRLLPPHDGYALLRNILMQYRNLSDNHPHSPIISGPKLQLESRHDRVRDVKKRLEVLGDLSEIDGVSSDLFDKKLEEAVRKFQQRHGLEIDGIVGPRTLAALNVPLDDRIRQIELNLERWRWIPHELGQRHILVNIADYKLTVSENDEKVMDMKVVVGREYRRTPVFSEKMTYIVINPFWNIPTSIAVKDILPKIIKDPEYLNKMGINVFESWHNNARVVDPYLIEWSGINPRNFGYRLRQDPGPENALGRIKFMFPNKFAVYLHDTPSKNLFERNRRGFSSGCIRLEQPIELAKYLLIDHDNWTSETILKAIDNEKRRVVSLNTDVYVHLLYWTAWIDKKGNLNFREDIYNRDEPLNAALLERPPRSFR